MIKSMFNVCWFLLLIFNSICPCMHPIVPCIVEWKWWCCGFICSWRQWAHTSNVERKQVNFEDCCLLFWLWLCYQCHYSKCYDTHTHTCLTALCSGLRGWAGTGKVKPIWILLKQETVRGSGTSWAICKSAHCSRQITTSAPHRSVFYMSDALPAAQPTVSKFW